MRQTVDFTVSLDPALTDKFCSLPVLHIPSTRLHNEHRNSGNKHHARAISSWDVHPPGAILFSCLVTLESSCNFRTFFGKNATSELDQRLNQRFPSCRKAVSTLQINDCLKEQILKVSSTGAQHVASSYQKKKKEHVASSVQLLITESELQHICS